MKQNQLGVIAICVCLLFSFCSKRTQRAGDDTNERRSPTVESVPPASSYTISMGGNAFVTKLAPGSSETVTAGSLANWTNANSQFSAYFRLALTGSLTVKLRASVPSGASVVKVTVNGTPFTVNLSGSTTTIYDVGTVNINAVGYVKVDFQGISKTGSYFADVYDLIISGTATASNVVYANDANKYNCSRRGPIVQARYSAPFHTEWMYNEVTVPAGEDKIGSYIMASGFTGGYFGIQVNSSTERRVIFSVLDASEGKTTLVRKGPDVVVDNALAGEGTGGQSYLVFNWAAGNTYRFLTQGKPDGKGNTQYSAWIFTPETNTWRFIATWSRPNTTQYPYLSGLNSFLENFNPDNGYLGRKVYFSPPQVRNDAGKWYPIVRTTIYVDATGDNQQRMDFTAGLQRRTFFLQHCGFFTRYTEEGSVLYLPKLEQPAVDLSTLP